MSRVKSRDFSRRDFVKLAGAGVVAAGKASIGPFFLFPLRAQAKQKTLRILQWRHPVPGYDQWFDKVLAKQWGERNATSVIVDHVEPEGICRRATEEANARRGHDLVMFISPPAIYESSAIDHGEIYQEAQARHGRMILLAHKSTFNPRTKKYFAFSDCYMPAPSHWLFHPWQQLGLIGGPLDYDTLRKGAKEIREKFGLPCGIGLSNNLASNTALRAVLWSFGGSAQDADGNVAVNSSGTIEALKYIKALYQESETPEALTWGPSDNIRAMLGEKISFTVNAIFLTRQGEKEKPDVAKKIVVSPAMKGPASWLSCPHVTSCYVIWEFAQNKEGAKQFLVNLIDNYSAAFRASELCNFPSFPSLAPNLLGQLENDPQAIPPYKYVALQDTLHWTRNLGYPGYATPAIADVFRSHVVPRMFAQVAQGHLSPEDGAAAAEREMRRIFEKWRQS